ncbi:conserved hypothetical protein, membrane, partial [mine drainage metagenome]
MHRRMLREGLRARGRLGATIALGVFAGLLAVAQALLLSRIIAGAFLGGADLSALVGPLALLAGVFTLRAASGYGRDAFAAAFSAEVRQNLRSRLLQRILALGPVRTSGERTGELITTALGGVDALDPFLAHYLPQIAF